MAADEFGRVGGIAFDGEPDVAIEDVFVNAVGLAEIHLLDLLGPVARLGERAPVPVVPEARSTLLGRAV